MKQAIFLLLLGLSNLAIVAQVGVNTINPTTTLDVVGDVKTEGSLYLENPGDFTEIRGSKLLILSPSDNIVQYDISQSKYGPINYAEFVFRNLSKDGLQDYDTKISTEDYIVTVQGYYFLETVSSDTDIMTHSTIANDNIEGYQIYAYANPVTQTWFLRAFVNNSEFHTRIGSAFAATPIDMYLNLIIYRKGFISKTLDAVTIDMGNAETGTAPLPEGF
ncbi:MULTISPECIES: hypothetical protein [Altibacter]|uniref:hypothetical protein n=1 Tax=Altibacter TaxID=1535231 RepID=UPI0005545741|nr:MULTISPECIES: hypothetical protein [Altibacter]MCW8981933.1 hypothetical protein [Altibacter sp.]MCW9036552.1 hypothetical protein [Altibacter sp.]